MRSGSEQPITSVPFIALAALVTALGCVESDFDQPDDFADTAEDLRENPPPEDGFVNPLSGKAGTTEIRYDDGYYSALDYTHKNPGVGAHHCGEDWNYDSGGSGDLGAPVYATANGKVVSAGSYGTGWGKIVMIEHWIPRARHPTYEHITSTYAHLASYSVRVGDVVRRGQEIGALGDADGYYRGAAHLHFEMRWNHELGPTANHGYQCPNDQAGTFDPTDFIDAHPPGWSP